MVLRTPLCSKTRASWRTTTLRVILQWRHLKTDPEQTIQVAATESTRASISGSPGLGKEHHSSLLTIPWWMTFAPLCASGFVRPSKTSWRRSELEITAIDERLSCPPSSPVAPKTSDNSGTCPLYPLQINTFKWQQRPETPALISRIHVSSSHQAFHQCSDSAQTRSPPEITPGQDSWSRDAWQLNWEIWKSQRTDRRYGQSPPRFPPVLHSKGQRKRTEVKAR